MGNILSSIANALREFSIFQQNPCRILMLGLDAAGKTTILYKLKLNEEVATIPTIGFNVENVTPIRVTFTVWDVGGQEKIRALWKHYFTGTEGLIFVVDSNDKERAIEARDELFRVITDEEMLPRIPVVVVANKQDMEASLSSTELVELMDLQKLPGNPWHIQGTCALTGDGLDESVRTLAKMVNEFRKEHGNLVGTREQFKKYIKELPGRVGESLRELPSSVSAARYETGRLSVDRQVKYSYRDSMLQGSVANLHIAFGGSFVATSTACLMTATTLGCRLVAELAGSRPLDFEFAGKTLFLYRLKLNKFVTTIPTIGFNVETVEVEGMDMTLWDAGGGDKMRPLYRHYYPNCAGIVFMIDSSDRERVEEARDFLHETMRHDDLPRNIPVMVIANKQDLPNAIPPAELLDLYALDKLTGHNAWTLQEASCTTGDGVQEAANTLAKMIKQFKKDFGDTCT